MSSGCRTFGDVVEALQVDLLRYLRRLTANGAEADDLFQETLLRGLKAFGRLDPEANHRAWMYRIATNVFLNHHRSKRRNREVPLDHEPLGSNPGRGPTGDAASVVRRYHRAVARLPRRQRAAFVQRRLLEWSYEDIARVMGGTTTAARANVYQAARRLRRELADLNPARSDGRAR